MHSILSSVRWIPHWALEWQWVSPSWQEVQSPDQRRKELSRNFPILPPQPTCPLPPLVTQTHWSAGMAFSNKNDKSRSVVCAQTSCRNTFRAEWRRSTDLHHHRWKVFTRRLLSYNKAVRPISVLAHGLRLVFCGEHFRMFSHPTGGNFSYHKHSCNHWLKHLNFLNYSN